MITYIWGTGCSAGELFDKGLDINSITGFVDNNPSSEIFLGLPVITPAKLPETEYDLIVVASRKSKEIEAQCKGLGVPSDKLFYIKNHSYIADMNTCADKASLVLPPETMKEIYLDERIIREPLRLGESKLDVSELENDYVRIKTLELCAEELRGVPGAAAELGVYKGGFARCINAVMPERKLYLFDTFEGFEKREANKEVEAEHCGKAFVAVHRNTNIECVLKMLPHPEKATVVQGLFPESANGLEDSFAFVSIDVDFEESAYAGLMYFYPRAMEGAFIFLHDYNSPKLLGVRRAVHRYEEHIGHRLNLIPICDINGTAVIKK